MRQHVVVVDDTEINLRLLETLIARLENCDCHSFSCPKTALAFCSDNSVDLLIVDYMMPEMDGIEWIRQLRQVSSQSSTPVLMITANEAKSVRYDALESGADDFLTKPVDAVEFVARTRNMLKLSAANRALHDRAHWLNQEVQKEPSKSGSVKETPLCTWRGSPNTEMLKRERISCEWRITPLALRNNWDSL